MDHIQKQIKKTKPQKKMETLELEIPTSEFSITPEFNTNLIDLINKTYEYNKITDGIKKQIDSIFDSYLDVGYDLKKIEDEKLYEMEDYKSIQDYAFDKFNLSKTTVHNIMAISQRFTDENGRLLNEYKGYSFSTLVELVSVDQLDLESYSSVMTVKDIRNKKLENKLNAIVDESLSSVGSVSQIIERIKAFDIHGSLNSFDPRLTYAIAKENYDLDKFYWGYKFNVNFSIQNLPIRSKKVDFELSISNRGYRINTSNNDIYVSEDIEQLSDVDTYMKRLCDKINELSIKSAIEPENSIKSSYKSSYSEITNKNQWSWFQAVLNAVAEQLPFKVYYDFLNNSTLCLYREDKKSTKKNPPILTITNPSELHKLQIIFDGSKDDKHVQNLESAIEMLINVRLVDTISKVLEKLYEPSDINVKTLFETNGETDEA